MMMSSVSRVISIEIVAQQKKSMEKPAEICETSLTPPHKWRSAIPNCVGSRSTQNWIYIYMNARESHWRELKLDRYLKSNCAHYVAARWRKRRRLDIQFRVNTAKMVFVFAYAWECFCFGTRRDSSFVSPHTHLKRLRKRAIEREGQRACEQILVRVCGPALTIHCSTSDVGRKPQRTYVKMVYWRSRQGYLENIEKHSKNSLFFFGAIYIASDRVTQIW